MAAGVRQPDVLLVDAGVKPFAPPPARATRALIAMCVAVQIALTLVDAPTAAGVQFAGSLIPLRLTAGIDGAVWAPLTLLTSIFLHGGWLHLALNVMFLAWVGKYVEWVVGPVRFVVLYLLGGLAGGVVQVASDPQSIVQVVGASGAIAAVFGCYAVLFARSRASARTVFGIAISSEAVTAAWFAAVWIGLQLLSGAVFGAAGLGVAVWAHVGGFVTGLVFAQPFVKSPPPAV